jgi:hypothetical protein
LRAAPHFSLPARELERGDLQGQDFQRAGCDSLERWALGQARHFVLRPVGYDLVVECSGRAQVALPEPGAQESRPR